MYTHVFVFLFEIFVFVRYNRWLVDAMCAGTPPTLYFLYLYLYILYLCILYLYIVHLYILYLYIVYNVQLMLSVLGPHPTRALNTVF